MAFLEIENVCKGYGDDQDRTEVLKDISLDIEEGEFVAIVGFSESGKTTLISTIAGLIVPDQGLVRLKGKQILGPGPERGVVFQSYSLLPWLTVEGNVALAVDEVFAADTRADRKARVRKFVDLVGLTPAIDRRPAELSGGMRQRVAVARALALSPEILLLDEPLSALDALTRANLQDEIEAIWRQEKKTVVLITNDVDEAILLADRVIPLNPGPNATLGPEFRIRIPRPRDRLALNDVVEFKRLRSEITSYLMQIGRENGVDAPEELSLPNVTPITQRDEPPEAYRKAAHSPITERYVEFSQVKKIYPTPQGPLTVVDGFDLRTDRGEFVSLIGHSGCGKSTVLSMVAGLDEVSSGGIVLKGREIDGASPERAVVFQAPSPDISPAGGAWGRNAWYR